MGGANGLIVAFVVAVWAAYFVPLVLRRYDEATSSESLESLSPLSRVVSRRRASASDADVEDLDDDADEESRPREKATEPVRPTTTRRAAIVAARRRRRTLLTLLTALLITGGLAAFSVVAPVWVALPAGVVVAWLVACRVQVRAERGISRPRAERASLASRLPSLPRRERSDAQQGKAQQEKTRRSSRKAPRERTVDDEQTIVVSGQFEEVDPDRRHVMQRTELPADALEEKLQIAVPSVATSGTPLWDPLPVTLPTYVTKPRVGRTVRTIDFDAPGTWTSGHVEGEDVELPGRPATGEAQRQQPRRAAGQ